ncbi:serine/threonine-protein kinase [Roseateles cellulosilyticus]|uniref:Protein kinase n=1 Tax=Pelomonas cellulosilytica TaxID=2906762 RepID=A0ABS8XZ11_9BURK|nr:serine/threonine-protein kinase [Pelomonas sp. P8]MCE4557077.1 protein kinase [Pelomonas sp. P8]
MAENKPPLPPQGRLPRLSRLMSELMELGSDARAVRLEQIRTEEPLLADELTGLLAQLETVRSRSFLDGTAFPGDATLSGRRFGNYTLIRPIGQGGMSTVWLAERSDGSFEGRVAVKLLNLALMVHAGTERFRREGNLLARLAHPHIAHLIDAGVETDGQPYLVLEYVAGDPIDRWCEQRHLDVASRVRLFLDVLEAVGHAHNNLVLHRDLKPSNILVTPDGQVKLLDFGVATLLEAMESPVPPSELTRSEGRVFTPAFAAPEQILGDSVSTATDVYSLGVLLYQLLSGRHPTSGQSQTPVEVLRRVIDTDPVRLSDAAAGSPEGAAPQAPRPKVVEALRGDLDNIVGKALKKDAAERYPTSAAFAEDLRRYLNDEPVSAHADSFGYRAKKFLRRRRREVALGAAMAATLVIGIASTLWLAHEAMHEREIATKQRARAERALLRSEADAEFTRALLIQIAQSPKPLTYAQILERGERLAMQQTHPNPAQQAATLLILADLHGTFGNDRKALELTEQALTWATKAADAGLMAMVGCIRAEAVASLGDPSRGAQLAIEAQEMAKDDQQAQVRCWQQRALIAMTAKDGAEMLKSAQQALAALDQVANPSATTRALVISDVASAYRLLGQGDAADVAYGQAIDALRKVDKADSLEASTIWNNWGANADMTGQDALAVERYLRGVKDVAQLLGDDAVGGAVLNNLARKLARLNRLDEAWSFSDQALQRFIDTGSSDRLIALAELAKSEVKLAQGHIEDAQTRLNAAWRRLAARGATIQSPVPALLLQQARIDRAAGKPNAALEAIEEIERRRRAANTTLPPSSEHYRLFERAGVQLELGRLALAEADAREALSIARRLQGTLPASSFTGSTLLTLSRIKKAQGDASAARDTAREAETQLKATLGTNHPQTLEAARLAKA